MHLRVERKVGVAAAMTVAVAVHLSVGTEVGVLLLTPPEHGQPCLLGKVGVLGRLQQETVEACEWTSSAAKGFGAAQQVFFLGSSSSRVASAKALDRPARDKR